jgi:hypothetical protein
MGLILISYRIQSTDSEAEFKETVNQQFRAQSGFRQCAWSVVGVYSTGINLYLF